MPMFDPHNMHRTWCGGVDEHGAMALSTNRQMRAYAHATVTPPPGPVVRDRKHRCKWCARVCSARSILLLHQSSVSVVSLTLCFKHMPPQHMIGIIQDTNALVRYIRVSTAMKATTEHEALSLMLFAKASTAPSQGLCRQIATHRTEHEAVLLMVFTKSSTTPTLWNRRVIHTDVELLVIDSPPPVVPPPGIKGTDSQFDSWQALRVRVDRLKGVTFASVHAMRTSSDSHNILSVSLKRHEYKAVVEFIHQVRKLPYNHWDDVFSRTATLISVGVVPDIVIDEAYNVCRSITSVHAPQLVALIFRHCIDRNRTAPAKLWGFNSRLITANEIFEQLRVTCMAIDTDALSRGMLRALSEGVAAKNRA
ncbi:hypothetical protein T484DRAFT_1740615 [Baffinella frigidus]|nr:hypothetical protein T484DRAFT_1740615 [Cryptophyta sp. CCMP2293]